MFGPLVGEVDGDLVHVVFRQLGVEFAGIARAHSKIFTARHRWRRDLILKPSLSSS